MSCITLLCAFSQAQTPSRPRFEVASLKPSGPLTSHPARRISGGPGTASLGQISYYQQSLKNLIFMAYRVQFYQLSTPSWTEHEYFDISAKVPAGATKDDVALMLQDLLAERLKLKIRRESREIPGYVLTVGRNGAKLKPSDAADGSVGDSPEAGKAPKFGLDKGGFIIAPQGRTNMLTLPGKDGVVRLTAARATIDLLSGYLSRQLQRPVLNQTGLNGTYDFHLAFTRVDVTSPADFEQADTAGSEGAVPRAADPAPTLFKAVESQLGLRMQAKSVPTDVLVIEHVERIPIEN